MFVSCSLCWLFGHVITTQSVQPNPNKLSLFVRDHHPKTLSTLRSFLGLTIFYCQFIWHYATIITPLTDLLKDNVPFTLSIAIGAVLMQHNHRLAFFQQEALPQDATSSGLCVGNVFHYESCKEMDIVFSMLIFSHYNRSKRFKALTQSSSANSRTSKWFWTFRDSIMKFT